MKFAAALNHARYMNADDVLLRSEIAGIVQQGFNINLATTEDQCLHLRKKDKLFCDSCEEVEVPELFRPENLVKVRLSVLLEAGAQWIKILGSRLIQRDHELKAARANSHAKAARILAQQKEAALWKAEMERFEKYPEVTTEDKTVQEEKVTSKARIDVETHDRVRGWIQSLNASEGLSDSAF